jgi:hypothetical protein
MQKVIQTAPKTNLKPADIDNLTTELSRYTDTYDPLFPDGNNKSTATTSGA